jgi:hypothetical protein
MTNMRTHTEPQQTAEQRRNLLWHIYATILSDRGREEENEEERADASGAAVAHVSDQPHEGALISTHDAHPTHASAPVKPS